MTRRLVRSAAALAVVAVTWFALSYQAQAQANPAPSVTQTATCADVTLTLTNNATGKTIGIRFDGGAVVTVGPGQTRSVQVAFGTTHTVQWAYPGGTPSGTITVTAQGQPESCTTTTTAAPTTTAPPSSTVSPTSVAATTTTTTAAPTTTAASTTTASSTPPSAVAPGVTLPPTGGVPMPPAVWALLALVAGGSLVGITRIRKQA